MVRLDASTSCCFFFNDTATTEIYTLSLHDALPISQPCPGCPGFELGGHRQRRPPRLLLRQGTCPEPSRRRWLRDKGEIGRDRKSTRLNSSHANISYAVFCLKKKK